MRSISRHLLQAAPLLALSACCAPTRPDAFSSPPAAPVAVAGVDRFIALTPTVSTGSEPLGAEGFTALAARGVDTVVCVDGMLPDAEAAQKAGLTVYHIPIGYDGIPLPAAASLQAISRTQPGSLYIHCHHGRHRGPAAAALYLKLTGSHDASQAEQLLHHCGTGSDYTGLWQSVRSITQKDLPATHPPLTAQAPLDDLTERMAHIDRIWDRIKGLAETPQPDVKRSHAERDALYLWEAFRETHRAEALAPGDIPLTDWKDAENAAYELRIALQNRNREKTIDTVRTLKSQCTQCHKAHR